jgi:hypothetical protein
MVRKSSSCESSPALEVLHLDALRSGDLADDERIRLAVGPDALESSVDLVLGDDDDHADTAVERPRHLLGLDATNLLEPLEHTRELPGGGIELASGALGKDTRDVLGEASSRDVGHALEEGSPDRRKELLDVDSGRGKEVLSEGLGGRPGARGGVGELRASDNLADKGEAVRVKTRRGESEEDVSRGNVGSGEEEVTLDRTDGETGEVVVLAVVHTGHLGGLTSNEGATGIEASGGDTLDDGGGRLDVERGASEVVEEVERLGTLNDEVVDRHGDEVDTDGRVRAAVKGDLELGSDTVGARNEDRVDEASGLEVKGSTKASNLTVSSRAASRLNGRLDGLDELLSAIDGDTGRGIRESLRAGGSGSESTRNGAKEDKRKSLESLSGKEKGKTHR